jgi:uncharacterized protein (TIGR02145 family)
MTSSPWVVVQSQCITLNGGNQNIGNLQVCGPTPNNFSDIDGNTYPYIQIGTQTWSQTNLNVTKYQNGDPIPQVTDSATWVNLTTGAWCWYNNDSANYWIYGKLYNGYAANDPRGLAPIGWHVPTHSEWNIMTKFLDPSIDTLPTSCQQGFDIAIQLKNSYGWAWNTWDNVSGNGTNSSGFSALPAGIRGGRSQFGIVGQYCSWWATPPNNPNFPQLPQCRTLYARYNNVFSAFSDNTNNFGLSVRCIRN